MLARLRLLLLLALVLAPLQPVRAAASTGHGTSGADAPSAAAPLRADAAVQERERPVPTIASSPGPVDEGARAADRAELLTRLAQVLATDGTLPRSTAGIPAPAACRAAGWSDVVQCRRWAGAYLLLWATPPPARA